MKKIFAFLILFFFSFTLVSCGDDHKITVVLENGETKTVELKATEDPEISKYAVMYVKAANYKTSKVKLDAKASLELDDKYSNSKISGEASLALDDKNADASFNGNMTYTNKNPFGESQNLPTEALTQKVEMSGNAYYKLKDEFVYVDVTAKQGSTTISQKNKLILDNFLPSTTPNTNVTDFDSLLEELYTLPNVKFSISSVERKSFTLKLSISGKDVLEYFGETNVNVNEDVNIYFTHSFKTGRLESLKTNFNLTDAKTNNKFAISLEIKLSYGKFTVRTLNDSEKAQYVLF